MPDALDLLEADHHLVRRLLGRLTEPTRKAAKARSYLLERLRYELDLHTLVEEELFYPALMRAAGSAAERERIAASFEEHRAITSIVLPDLSEQTSMVFLNRAKLLRELVENHLADEEETMFGMARELLEEATLRQLGERIYERKRQLESMTSQAA